MNTSHVDDSTPSVLQASKWLQLQALLDVQEMEQLLGELEDVKLFIVGKLIGEDEETIAKEEFLEKYGEYITLLKSGEIPDETVFRPFFSSALTFSDNHLFSIPAAEGKKLMRISKPCVQMQLHMMGYSAIEQKFRPMILGKDSIHWGVQFSYPQLCINPETKKVENVLTGDSFPNTRLFRTIQNWIRKNTIPTPFLVGGKKTNVPMRLGKCCFEWINNHPQLQALGIRVVKK